jgi:hypothetical protein
MNAEKPKGLNYINCLEPKMNENVGEFIRVCSEYQKNEFVKHIFNWLLHDLYRPYIPWQCILMDFIIELPLSEESDQM